MIASCPVCHSTELETIGNYPDLPALCNALWPDAETARNAARGDVHLSVCHRCSTITNVAFDPAVFGYSPAYENSLHFSPAFQTYALSVAERLAERFALRSSTIVEIGPGSGDFLALMCTLGDNRGIGYDPSHDPERAPADLDARVSIVAEHFPVDGTLDADFVVARHVLEHVGEPGPLVGSIRRALGDTGRGAYLEVPDAGYMVRAVALWDVIYEHCIYFTDQGLGELLTASGLNVSDMGSSFGDQFLWAEATPGEAGSVLDSAAVAELVAEAQAFRARTADLMERAASTLTGLLDAGPVALWGAGSKGVSFLNMVPRANDIAAVVDINPHKDTQHIPVSAQEVIAPTRLKTIDPRTVLILNPNYQSEIRDQVANLGLTAEVVTLD